MPETDSEHEIPKLISLANGMIGYSLYSIAVSAFSRLEMGRIGALVVVFSLAVRNKQEAEY